MSGPHPYRLRIGIGLLGGMAAWGLHLGVSYLAVPWACARDAGGVLHALTAGAAALAAVAIWAAWSAWGRMEGPMNPQAFDPEVAVQEPEAPDGGVALAGKGAGVAPFLAVAGVLLSGFFLVLILAEGLPLLLQRDPCLHVPTLDRLIVLGGGEGAVGEGAAALLVGGAARHDWGGLHPDEIWGAWHWDPWILGALALATTVYATGLGRLWRRAGRGSGIPGWRAAAYGGGLVTLFVALISPVHAAGEALFSLHMVQHLLLMTVAAPLLALGRPTVAYLWALPGGGRRGLVRHRRLWAPVRRAGGWLAHPATIFVLHVGALWAWHTPQLYEAALREPWIHDLEHASFFVTALLFWWALVRSGGPWARARYGAAILYVLATALQSGALGALITFAPEPWYATHAARTPAWGLPPLVDQQLAGILMWVPVGLVYAAAIVALFVGWLNEAERRAERVAPTVFGVGPSSHP